MNSKKTLKIAHYGCHYKANLNSGDTLLFQIARDLFDSQLNQDIDWSLRQIWDEVSEDEINEINEDYDALIIGGGGVFLKDQEGSDVSNSGWQWNCSLDLIRMINVPIIMFAVGYNRFRGQDDFNEKFSKSVTEISRRSPFFSLRNQGSINAIKPYIKNDDIDNQNIVRQFCPTTVIDQIPKYRRKSESDICNKTRRLLSFNAAFDRTEMRSSDPQSMYDRTCLAIKEAEKRDWDIFSCSHKFMDKQIEDYLKRHNIKYDTFDLTESDPAVIIDYYNSIDLSVGMRGHSQLIPFGLSKYIYSFISHDKLSFFLDDLDIKDMGSEIDSESFIEDFASYLDKHDQDPGYLDSKLSKARDYVWSETLDNFKQLNKIFEN